MHTQTIQAAYITNSEYLLLHFICVSSQALVAGHGQHSIELTFEVALGPRVACRLVTAYGLTSSRGICSTTHKWKECRVFSSVRMHSKARTAACIAHVSKLACVCGWKGPWQWPAMLHAVQAHRRQASCSLPALWSRTGRGLHSPGVTRPACCSRAGENRDEQVPSYTRNLGSEVLQLSGGVCVPAAVTIAVAEQTKWKGMRRLGDEHPR